MFQDIEYSLIHFWFSPLINQHGVSQPGVQRPRRLTQRWTARRHYRKDPQEGNIDDQRELFISAAIETSFWYVFLFWKRPTEDVSLYKASSNTMTRLLQTTRPRSITLERPWGGCPPGIQVAADRAPRSGWVTPERPPAVLPWFNDLANGQWKNIFFQTDANHKTNIRTEFFNSKQINRVFERPNSTESKLNYRFYV